MANISDFKAQLIQGGARANQFLVQLTFPAVVPGGPLLSYRGQFLCKAASLPAATIDDTPINYRGRVVHFAGERTFDPWTVSIYTDNDFSLKNAFEVWSNAINSFPNNTGLLRASDYQVDFQVFQLDRNGSFIKGYQFIDAYPTVIGPITLDFDTNNTIEIFDVTFVYNYWLSDTTDNGFSTIGVTINTPGGSLPI